MTTAIRLRGLEVAAGGRRLLGPLDLDVEEGAYALLVGASGSGKTTLLRAVAGLAVPSAGIVELFGERASEAGALRVEPRKRGVGMLFQGGALWPHMSARRTLEFTLASAGVPRGERRERASALLEEVALPGYEERMPGTLSGGERQRLALARALATEPRLLLLDEPLGPLDAELRTNLMETIGTLHARGGRTTLHVTHDPAEAERIATRTVRLDGGLLADPSGAGS